MISKMTMPAFNANTAGRNWILASQPNHLVANPEKSMNMSMNSMKTMPARAVRIFFSISQCYCEVRVAAYMIVV